MLADALEQPAAPRPFLRYVSASDISGPEARREQLETRRLALLQAANAASIAPVIALPRARAAAAPARDADPVALRRLDTLCALHHDEPVRPASCD